MGKLAQIKTTGTEYYRGVSRSEIRRLLSCGHSPASIAAQVGVSLREVRRIAKRSTMADQSLCG